MVLNRTPPKRPGQPYRYEKQLGFLTLDTDDLGSVVRFLAGCTRSLVLRAGHATLDAPEDLAAATGSELARVSIATSEPRVEVNFGRAPSVYTTDDSDEARRIVDESAALLSQFRGGKWRHYRKGLATSAIFLGGFSLLFLVVVLVMALIAGSLGSAGFWNMALLLTLAPAGLWLLVAILNYFTGLKPEYASAFIVPENKASRRSSAATRSREILVALVGAVVGGLLVWVLSLLQG